MTGLPEHIARARRRRQPRLDHFLDNLLGPRCPRCWLRVFPRDQHLHDKDCD